MSHLLPGYHGAALCGGTLLVLVPGGKWWANLYYELRSASLAVGSTIYGRAVFLSSRCSASLWLKALLRAPAPFPYPFL
jgi:hypothetical protein